MSIAGKVLTVLIMLGLLVWIFLVAQVAELNRNWGQQISKLQKDAEQAKEQAAKLREDVAKVRSQIALEQVQKDAQLTRMRSQISNLEKQNSFTRETLDRYNLQLNSVQAAVASAQEIQKIREDELVATNKAVQDSLAELNQLVRTNNDMLGELGRLREEFRDTLESNKQLVARWLQNRDTAGRPRVRPATATAR